MTFLIQIYWQFNFLSNQNPIDNAIQQKERIRILTIFKVEAPQAPPTFCEKLAGNFLSYQVQEKCEKNFSWKVFKVSTSFLDACIYNSKLQL